MSHFSKVQSVELGLRLSSELFGPPGLGLRTTAELASSPRNS